MDLRAQHFHALDVRGLALHVDRAHVNLARHAEERGNRGRGDAMHPRAGLGDQALLAHAAREQRLPDGVVHLVRTRVVQVFALEENLRAAQAFAQAPRMRQRRFPPDIVVQELHEFPLERGIGLGRRVGLRQFVQRLHQCFSDVLSAVFSVVCVHCLSFLCFNCPGIKKRTDSLVRFGPPLPRSAPALGDYATARVAKPNPQRHHQHLFL